MSAAYLLAIGGTDSSGGAGLAADRHAAELVGVPCVSIVTAATEQTDAGVQALNPRAPDTWLFEALAAMSEQNPAAIKLGLLPGQQHVIAATSVLDQVLFESPGLPIVLDPVIASSSGHTFLDAAALQALRKLCGRPLILTPNLPEAAALTGAPESLLAEDPGARLAAAQSLLGLGLQAVALKGGHSAGTTVTDLLLVRDQPPVWSEHPRHPGPGIRGSGCRFATGLAAHLALGTPLPAAHQAASALVADLIARNVE